MSYALFLHQYGYHCYNFEILKLSLSYYLTICSTDESGISRYVGTAGQGLHINISLREPGYLKTNRGRENQNQHFHFKLTTMKLFLVLSLSAALSTAIPSGYP